MQNLTVLNSKGKKHMRNMINEQFGCDFSLDYEVFVNPKNKIFLLNKDISKIDIDSLRVNSLGLYFGLIYEKEIRLSIEGSQIIGVIATRNILKLNDDDAKKWMSGEDFEINSKLKDFVIIENKDDFLGCGKIINGKLLNYVQKERRV